MSQVIPVNADPEGLRARPAAMALPVPGSTVGRLQGNLMVTPCTCGSLTGTAEARMVRSVQPAVPPMQALRQELAESRTVPRRLLRCAEGAMVAPRRPR